MLWLWCSMKSAEQLAPRVLNCRLCLYIGLKKNAWWKEMDLYSLHKPWDILEWMCSNAVRHTSLPLHQTPDLNLPALLYLVLTYTGLKFVKVTRVMDCSLWRTTYVGMRLKGNMRCWAKLKFPQSSTPNSNRITADEKWRIGPNKFKARTSDFLKWMNKWHISLSLNDCGTHQQE